MQGLFVTGTDTNAGKTYLTCWLIKQMMQAGLVPGVYKPVCSGAVEQECTFTGTSKFVWNDVHALSAACNHQWTDDLISPQRFLAPLAPPIAAQLEQREVDQSLLLTGLERWKHQHIDLLLVEGAGGWFSPVATGMLVKDLARRIQFPVVLAARGGLGTINHTLLTWKCIAECLPVSAVILSCDDPNLTLQHAEDNLQQILFYARAMGLAQPKLTGLMPHNGNTLSCMTTVSNFSWQQLLLL